MSVYSKCKCGIALLLTLIFAVCSSDIYAFYDLSASEYTGNNIVNVSGVADVGKEVTLIIVDEETKVPRYVAQQTTNQNGVFEFKFEFNYPIEDCSLSVQSNGVLVSDKVIVSYAKKADAAESGMYIALNDTGASVTAYVNNMHWIEDLTFMPIIGLYSKEHVLIAVGVGEKVTAENNGYSSATINVDITPEEMKNVEYAKAFLWESKDTVVPLCECKVKTFATADMPDLDMGLSTGFSDISATDMTNEAEIRKSELSDQGLSEGVKNVDKFAVDGAKKVFVSLYGADGNDGTIAEPVRSLERAIELVDGLSGGAVIYFREGTYFVDDTIKISNINASSDKPLFISAYNDEDVIFTSAKELNYYGFKPVTDSDILNRLDDDARDKILVADFADVGINSDDAQIGFYKVPSITMDGEEMRFARYPKTSAIETVDYIDDGIAGAVSDTSYTNFLNEHQDNGFKYIDSDSRPSTWDNSRSIWLTGWFGGGSVKTNVAIAQIDDSGIRTRNIVTFYGRIQAAKHKETNHYYWNVLEELSLPGEFVLDIANKKIYIYPIHTGKSARLTMTKGSEPDQWIWSSLGSNPKSMFLLKNCSNIVISGIDFKESDLECININGGKGNVVQNCNFSNVYRGVYITGGENNGVSYCNFANLGSYAAAIRSGDNLYKDFKPKHNFIQNCFSYKGNFRVEGIGNVFSKNAVASAKSHAVYESGFEGIYENNEITQSPAIEIDAGAIYLDGHDPDKNPGKMGNIIRGNYIHDSINGTALYADERSYYNFMYNNIVKNYHEGLNINGGSYNVVTDNIFIKAHLYEKDLHYTRYLASADLKPLQTAPDGMLPETDVYKFYRGLALNRYPILKDYWSIYEASAENRMSGTYTKEGPNEEWFRKPHGNVISDNILNESKLNKADSADDSVYDNNTSGISDIEITNIGPDSGLTPLVTNKLIGYYPAEEQSALASDLKFVYSPVIGATRYRIYLADNPQFSNAKEYESTETICEAKTDFIGKCYWKVVAETDIETVEGLEMPESIIYTLHITE